MQEPDNQPQPDSDEIDLVDLTAVIVRYRRMILALVVGAVLASVALTVLAGQPTPITQPVPYTATATWRLAPEIEHLRERDAVARLISSPPVVLSALRAAEIHNLHGYSLGESVSRPVALAALSRLLDGNQFLEVTSEGPNLLIQANGLDQADDRNGSNGVRFLDALFQEGRRELSRYLAVVAQREIAAHTAFLETNPSQEAILATRAATARFPSALLIAAAPDQAVWVLHQPEALAATMPGSPAHRIPGTAIRWTRTTAVVLVFAAFFFALFLAFVLNYIDRVKADPVAMQKLRNAMRSPARTGKAGAGTP